MQQTKKKVCVRVNGFIYRAIRRGFLTKEEKRDLALDVIDFIRAENLKRLNSNRSDFIK